MFSIFQFGSNDGMWEDEADVQCKREHNNIEGRDYFVTRSKTTKTIFFYEIISITY